MYGKTITFVNFYHLLYIGHNSVQCGQNSDFKIKSDTNKKNSYDRRVYESVDDRSLS